MRIQPHFPGDGRSLRVCLGFLLRKLLVATLGHKFIDRLDHLLGTGGWVGYGLRRRLHTVKNVARNLTSAFFQPHPCSQQSIAYTVPQAIVEILSPLVDFSWKGTLICKGFANKLYLLIPFRWMEFVNYV